MHNTILILAAAGAAQGSFLDLAGFWTCAGRAEASPAQPAHVILATLQIDDGPWLRLRYTEQKTRENPAPQAAQERWGQLGSTLTRFLFDNSGGSGRAESPGWRDDALVWSGEYRLGPEKLAFRETFTRRDGALLESFELSQSGAWKVVASARCARAARK